MKHLLVDARHAVPQADGLGNYLRQHVPAIAAAGDFRTTLIVNPTMRDYWKSSAPQSDIVVTDSRPMWIGQHWEIPPIVRRIRPDLFFYPAHDPPLLLGTPFVFTVHDVTPHQVRPYFERNDKAKRAFLRFVTGRALRKAERVFAVSHATRTAIGDIFGDPAKRKTVVTHNGPIPLGRAIAGDRRFLLYVGTDRPHKNVPRLVEAYARAATIRSSLAPLHIVGGLRSADALRRQISALGLNERIVLHGHVDEPALEAAYAGAVALLMPSLSEGFGIPILEAMQRGVPVVTSETSGCAEIAGEAALLVNPWDVESIANGIVRVDSDAALRSRLAEQGRARVTEFSWARSSQIMIETFHTLLIEQEGRRIDRRLTPE